MTNDGSAHHPHQNHLCTEHIAELEFLSGINAATIAQRGYRTVHDIRELPAEFASYQCRAGLLIPLRSVRGTIESYQLKPFSPRTSADGKTIKYETAAKAPQVIDVPPAALPHIGNPNMPLVITEGAKKVDAAVSAGMVSTIGLQGVYGWRGQNEHGGKAALADWESIALNNRQVVIAFDSDVMSKASVRDALDRLSAFLTSKGAKVCYLLLPDRHDGSKCGLDDWFALGKDVASLEPHIVAHLPALADAQPVEPRPVEGPRLVTRLMSEVESRQIEWLWPNWLPKGMLTLLGGYAGDGKSTLTMALAAAFSTGGTLPDGSIAPTINTLLVATEDDDDKVIKPRLDVHGADHDRIRSLVHVELPDGGQRLFNLRTDVPILRQMVIDEGIGLVVIDPLSSVMANGDRNSEGDVRDTMQPLIRMMEETGVAVLGVMHIGKTDGQARTMQKLMGSTAFNALARAIWMVGVLPETFQFPDQPIRKALGVVKSNYAVAPASISFCRPLDAALEYLGESPVKIDDVFGWKDKPEKQGSVTETDKAEEWLLGFMDGKRMLASEVEAAAKADGFTISTLKKAKLRLGLQSERKAGQWYWLPPVDNRAA